MCMINLWKELTPNNTISVLVVICRELVVGLLSFTKLLNCNNKDSNCIYFELVNNNGI